MTTAMTNEAGRLNVATVPGKWHARLQAGTTPWAPRPLTQAHHVGPFQLPIVCLRNAQITNEWYWGSCLWEKCGYSKLCMKVSRKWHHTSCKNFLKITSFWYCCVFSWLYWENQWNERQEIGWVKSTYDLFQRTLKSKCYKRRGDTILLDTSNFESALG